MWAVAPRFWSLDFRPPAYTNLTVLDLSGAAIAAARASLGPAAEDIHWIEADVLTVDLLIGGFALWHDRAVFHFLTDANARAR